MHRSVEAARLASLRALDLLDTAPEESFDSIVALARDIAEVPIALVSLVDECRQWFKARVGLEVSETPRDVAFCAVAIADGSNQLVVPDATLDPRFADNPLVVGPPGIRFYAGFPFADPEGHLLGTLCVIDTEPRVLSDAQLSSIGQLTRLVESLLVQRIALGQLEEARRRSALFEAGFDSSQVGMQLVSPDGVLLRVNEAFADMLGSSAEELVGRHWQELTHPDDRRIRTGPTVDDLASGRHRRYRAVKRYLRSDGSVAWGDITVTPVFPDGPSSPDTRLHLTQVVEVSEQVSALEREREASSRLAASERRYRSLVEPAPDIVVRATVDGVLRDANRVAVRALGADSSEQLVGSPLRELLPPELADEFVAHFRAVSSSMRPVELWRQWLVPAGGVGGWYVVRIVPEIGDDSPVPHVFVVASEISEVVENERRLAEQAAVDDLTGCSSRGAIIERLASSLERIDHSGSPGLAVALVDLDHFKAINDRLGHLTGDAVLRAAARILREAVRDSDLVGRLGGDEFLVVLDGLDHPNQANELGQRIAAGFVGAAGDEELPLDEVSASVGVAWTDVAVPVNDLLARADRAMYKAKRGGGAQSRMERAGLRPDEPWGVDDLATDRG
ncbi:MAG: diguanylate cyclase [Actinomycetota bacterium]